MPILLTDPKTEEKLIAERESTDAHRWDGVLELAGKSDLANAAILSSGVIPFTFQLREGPKRPTIHLIHTGTGQAWTA